jgi:hypothetical protein
VRDALHPTEYEAQNLFGLGSRKTVVGLVLCYHGPGEKVSPERLAAFAREKKKVSF